MRHWLGLVKQEVTRVITYVLSPIRRIGLTNRDFTIISNNCWGGFVYQRYHLPYRSPFVGLFLPAPCFIELLEDFENNMKNPLRFISVQESQYFFKRKRILGIYPIALLGEHIEIHFLHYTTEQEAIDAWQRRKQRINPHNMLVKFAEMDWCTPDLVERFEKLPFKHKICLTAHNYPNCPHTLRLPRRYGTEQVANESRYVPPHLTQLLNQLKEQL